MMVLYNIGNVVYLINCKCWRISQMSLGVDNVFVYEDRILIVHQYEGEIWFKAKQILEILEFKNPRNVVRNEVEPEDRMPLGELLTKIGPTERTNYYFNGPSQQIMINECAIYYLVAKCSKYRAEMFKRWISKVVIPTLRRDGGGGSGSSLNESIGGSSLNNLYLSNKRKAKKVDSTVVTGSVV